MFKDCRSHTYSQKRDPEQASNYHLISFLSQFDEIMEKLIYNRITSFIEKNNLLCENQFGI